ncbi:hypothetical protein KSP40_PGU002905 [Platanthera guangdongensis]|uniref:Fanconi-associated nuclease n=1 Tax=Platanthera guangdongensis TaxID=2320717 RepID=A0ABR2LCV3_9ASPA
MLHGRESLVRLIGKRRRAFFSPLAHRLRSQNDSDSGEATPIHSKEHEPLIEGDRSRQARVAELVSCPVCDASVRGDDFSLNSHLDACLPKGKKRKLSQRTLLQVNFLSKSRGETRLVEADNVNADKFGKGISEESQISNFHRYDVLMLYGNDVRCESPKSMNPSLYNSEFGSGTSTLKVVDEDSVNGQTVDPHFPSGFSSTINAPRNGFCQDKDKDVSTLETFIVGRRFHEKAVLQHGARVYTLREPKNPKDDNAIKGLTSVKQDVRTNTGGKGVSSSVGEFQNYWRLVRNEEESVLEAEQNRKKAVRKRRSDLEVKEVRPKITSGG